MIRLFRIKTEECVGCETCVRVCKQGVFEMTEEDGKFVSSMIHPEKCDGCGICFEKCSSHGNPIEVRDSNEQEFKRVIHIDEDKCEACETCLGVCPEHNFEMVEKDGRVFAKVKDPEKCVCDGHCVFACKAKNKPQIFEEEIIFN